jgi:hypothetical protein
MAADHPDARPTKDSSALDPDVLRLTTDWHELEHAYGPATDIPAILSHLLEVNSEARAVALGELVGSVHHQNTIYSSTTPVALYIAAILPDERSTGPCGRGEAVRPMRAVLLDWLGNVAFDVDDDAIAAKGRRFSLSASVEEGQLRDARSRLGQATAAFLHDEDPDVRRSAAIATALLLDGSVPEHQRTELIPILLDTLTTDPDRIHRNHARDILHSFGIHDLGELEVADRQDFWSDQPPTMRPWPTSPTT